MLEDALRYPSRGEEWATTVFVGGLLPLVGAAIGIVAILLSVFLVGIVLLPLALVPQLFLWGYFVAVVRATLDGEPEPPRFADWGRLGVDGLKAFVVAVAYALPIVGLSIGVAIVAAVASIALGDGTAIVAVALGLFALLLLAYSLAVAYVLPAAVVNFVREDDLVAAFDLRTIAGIARDREYAVAWLLAAGVVLVGGFVAGLLLVLLVGFFLRFYVRVSAVRLVTRGVVRALDLDPDGRAAGDEPGDDPPADGRAAGGAG